jgi:TatD DNase family protein
MQIGSIEAFDALTHLDDPACSGRLHDVAAAARAVGVTGWVVAGADPDRWDAVLAAAAETGGIAALGAHPWWATAGTEPTLAAWLGRLDALAPRIVGEIGLDALHARTDDDRRAQRAAFRAQLAWARAHDRPVIVHAVRAVPEVLAIVARDGLPRAGGFLHGWTADRATAERALALGLHLGIGPGIARPTAHRIREVARTAPLDRLVLETDAPGPGAPGGPADLWRVAEAVARARGATAAAVLHATGRTARALLQDGA